MPSNYSPAQKTGQIYAKDATITEMLDELAAETGRPVVDRTGLTGRYNFLLAFTPLNSSRALSVPTSFKAIEEQTGMKLEETNHRGCLGDRAHGEAFRELAFIIFSCEDSRESLVNE